jgi:thymidylate kinase
MWCQNNTNQTRWQKQFLLQNMPKIKYIVIAGPQSCGKTTALEFLKAKYSDRLIFHKEINPYTVSNKAKLGSIVADNKIEHLIHSEVLKRIENINGNAMNYVAETEIFHLAYVLMLNGKKDYRKKMKEYIKALGKREFYVIFINTQPEISFKRRKDEYMARIRKEAVKRGMKRSVENKFRKEMLQKYEERIKEIYPNLITVYNDISFAKNKNIINNGSNSKKKFLGLVEKELIRILA